MSDSIFKSIFGAAWDDLPPVMKKHYANRPYSDDASVVEGTLDVMCKPPLKWLAPIMKAMGQIPCVNAENVPVTVRFESDKNTKAFHFVRTFHFKDARPYVFHSRMVQVKGDEVVEIMRFGLGWKMRYGWDGAKVTLTHRGYVLCAFGHFIPVPLGFLMGKGYAEERAVDENTFDMVTHITHPWWGKIYEYRGRFGTRKAMDQFKEKPSYEDLVLTIAYCVYDRMYQPEPLVDGTFKRNVDNFCSSARELPTHILMHFDLLKPLDTIFRRSEFTCDPSMFLDKITGKEPKECPYDLLILALMYLIEKYPEKDEIFEILHRMGICSETEERRPFTYRDIETGEIVTRSIRGIEWSEKADFYHEVYYSVKWFYGDKDRTV